MIVIKLQYGQDIRRVTIEKSASLVELVDLAKSLFKDTLPQSFQFKYKDDEGDLITIASDRELEEGFRLSKEQGLFKISIIEIKKEPVRNPQSIPVQKSPLDEFMETIIPYVESFENQLKEMLPKIEEQVQEFFPQFEEKLKQTFAEKEPEIPITIHPAVCDVCNQRIVGIRWKCLTCLDYDLCNSCKQKNVHNEHKFIQIDSVYNGKSCRGQCPFLRKVEEKEQPKTELPKEEMKAPKVESPKVAPKVESPKVAPKVESPKKEEKAPESPKKEEKAPESPKRETSKPIDIPSKKESPFESKLKQLEEMGFMNRGRNIEILVKNKGDMVLVVRDLLE